MQLQRSYFSGSSWSILTLEWYICNTTTSVKAMKTNKCVVVYVRTLYDFHRMKRPTGSQCPNPSCAFVKLVRYSRLMLSCSELKWVLFFLHVFRLVKLWITMEELFSYKGSYISMVYNKIKQKIYLLFHSFQVPLYIFSVSCTDTTISVENCTTN